MTIHYFSSIIVLLEILYLHTRSEQDLNETAILFIAVNIMKKSFVLITVKRLRLSPPLWMMSLIDTNRCPSQQDRHIPNVQSMACNFTSFKLVWNHEIILRFYLFFYASDVIFVSTKTFECLMCLHYHIKLSYWTTTSIILASILTILITIWKLKIFMKDGEITARFF